MVVPRGTSASTGPYGSGAGTHLEPSDTIDKRRFLSPEVDTNWMLESLKRVNPEYISSSDLSVKIERRQIL